MKFTKKECVLINFSASISFIFKEFLLKSGSDLLKKIVLFASLKAL